VLVADGTTPLAQAYRAYEQVEGQVSAALDQLVATNGFADLLATSATNVMALTRLANGTVDRFVRSTRLAARQDVTELARQLARTEDKLERLLQAVQTLQTSLEATSVPSATASPAPVASSAPAAEPTAAAEPEPAAEPDEPAAAPEPVAASNGTAGPARATAAARRRSTPAKKAAAPARGRS
jgi:hypothetical protein